MTKEEFKATRLELGYKRPIDLARELKVDISTIHKIEKGTRNPGLHLLLAFKRLSSIKG